MTRTRTRRWLGHLGTEVFIVVLGVLIALAVHELRQRRDDARLVEQMQHAIRSEVEANRARVIAARDRRAAVLEDWRLGGSVALERPRPPQTDDGDIDALLALVTAELGAQGVDARVELRAPLPPRGDVRRWQVQAHGLGRQPLPGVIELDAEHVRVRRHGGVMLATAEVVDSAWDTLQATGAALHLRFEVVERVARMREAQRRYERLAAQAAQLIYFGNLYGEALQQTPGGFIYTLEDLLGSENELLGIYDAVLAVLPSPS